MKRVYNTLYKTVMAFGLLMPFYGFAITGTRISEINQLMSDIKTKRVTNPEIIRQRADNLKRGLNKRDLRSPSVEQLDELVDQVLAQAQLQDAQMDIVQVEEPVQESDVRSVEAGLAELAQRIKAFEALDFKESARRLGDAYRTLRSQFTVVETKITGIKNIQKRKALLEERQSLVNKLDKTLEDQTKKVETALQGLTNELISKVLHGELSEEDAIALKQIHTEWQFLKDSRVVRKSLNASQIEGIMQKIREVSQQSINLQLTGVPAQIAKHYFQLESLKAEIQEAADKGILRGKLDTYSQLIDGREQAITRAFSNQLEVPQVLKAKIEELREQLNK